MLNERCIHLCVHLLNARREEALSSDSRMSSSRCHEHCFTLGVSLGTFFQLIAPPAMPTARSQAEVGTHRQIRGCKPVNLLQCHTHSGNM